MEIYFKTPRMASIRETAEIFGLPVHFVRQKVNNGEVVAVRAGRKFLVNIDRFSEYLNTSKIQSNKETVNSFGITKISLKGGNNYDK